VLRLAFQSVIELEMMKVLKLASWWDWLKDFELVSQSVGLLVCRWGLQMVEKKEMLMVLLSEYSMILELD